MDFEARYSQLSQSVWAEFNTPDGGSSFRLHPEEAREVAARLVAAADEADAAKAKARRIAA